MTDVAVVTGGTGSIGGAVCKALVRGGWQVVAGDSVPPVANVDEIVFVACDVRSRDSVGALIEAAARIGSVGALVNAHGILRETPLETFDEATADAIIDVNLKGVARVCRAAARAMQSGASIVNLSSVTASMGRARNAFVYQATKAGVEAITRSFAVTLAPRGIRVNCVSPGYLSEPMRGEGVHLRARQGGNAALEAFTPSGRLITPPEVAEAVAFLCSSRASGISGVVLPVDGAQLAY